MPSGDSAILDAGYFATPFFLVTLSLTAIFLAPLAALPLHFLIYGFLLTPIHLLHSPQRYRVAVECVILQQSHVDGGGGTGGILGASLVKLMGMSTAVATISGGMLTTVAALAGLGC